MSLLEIYGFKARFRLRTEQTKESSNVTIFDFWKSRRFVVLWFLVFEHSYFVALRLLL